MSDQFKVSFGVQYPSVPHPRYPKANGHGYVTILADTAKEAREAALKLFGRDWARMYQPEREMEARYWPLNLTCVRRAEGTGSMSAWGYWLIGYAAIWPAFAFLLVALQRRADRKQRARIENRRRHAAYDDRDLMLSKLPFDLDAVEER